MRVEERIVQRLVGWKQRHRERLALLLIEGLEVIAAADLASGEFEVTNDIAARRWQVDDERTRGNQAIDVSHAHFDRPGIAIQELERAILAAALPSDIAEHQLVIPIVATQEAPEAHLLRRSLFFLRRPRRHNHRPRNRTTAQQHAPDQSPQQRLRQFEVRFVASLHNKVGGRASIVPLIDQRNPRRFQSNRLGVAARDLRAIATRCNLSDGEPAISLDRRPRNLTANRSTAVGLRSDDLFAVRIQCGNRDARTIRLAHTAIHNTAHAASARHHDIHALGQRSR